MTIGARVLKTGLAVAVALWVGMLVKLDTPLIAAIAAIFTIQPSIYRSWVQLLDQLQGNMMGAAIAIVAVWSVGNSPILVGGVCIGVILLCLRLRVKEDAIGLTLVTVVVVMEAQGESWLLAFDRLAAILTGIVSAFVVNVAVAPPRHRNRFVNRVQEAEALLSRLLRTAISNELKETVFQDEYKRIRGMLRKLEEFYALFAEERVWRREVRLQRARLLIVYQGMIAALEKGVSLLDAVEEIYFSVSTAQAWNRIIDRQIESLCGYHEQLMWKWQGKMKPGSHAAAPPEEVSMLLSEMIVDRDESDPTSRAKLLVITSAVFSYEQQLRRLDKLMEQWLQREERGHASDITVRAE
ncbi:FUSC family protein [Cohnella panacarvi]|uniref:FUSC family protein n=1 Tax=Cohnella panacarvi TaxID=400776 RepID=UPI00047EA0A3|nr:aromatic acid exporter family protein [Cohnella panacarvi]